MNTVCMVQMAEIGRKKNMNMAVIGFVLFCISSLSALLIMLSCNDRSKRIGLALAGAGLWAGVVLMFIGR